MIKTKRGLRREALEFERVLTVNMLRARLKGLVLAWPDLGALPQGAWGGGSGGIGNVRMQRQTRIWKSQVCLKEKLLVVCRVAAAAPANKWRKREDRGEPGHGSMMWGVQAPHFLSLCFNLLGDTAKKRENLAKAHSSFRPPPTLIWPT